MQTENFLTDELCFYDQNMSLKRIVHAAPVVVINYQLFSLVYLSLFLKIVE